MDDLHQQEGWSNENFYLPDGIAPWSAQSVLWVLDFTIGFFGGQRDFRDEAVDQLGLKSLLHQPFGTLSKGQRKRVLLAIGLASLSSSKRMIAS